MEEAMGVVRVVAAMVADWREAKWAVGSVAAEVKAVGT